MPPASHCSRIVLRSPSGHFAPLLQSSRLLISLPKALRQEALATGGGNEWHCREAQQHSSQGGASGLVNRINGIASRFRLQFLETRNKTARQRKTARECEAWNVEVLEVPWIQPLNATDLSHHSNTPQSLSETSRSGFVTASWYPGSAAQKRLPLRLDPKNFRALVDE